MPTSSSSSCLWGITSSQRWAVLPSPPLPRPNTCFSSLSPPVVPVHQPVRRQDPNPSEGINPSHSATNISLSGGSAEWPPWQQNVPEVQHWDVHTSPHSSIVLGNAPGLGLAAVLGVSTPSCSQS